MGMFDSLYVSNQLLPLTEEQKENMPSDPGWQTKDFDRELTEIYITNEGELKINRWSEGEDESGKFIRNDENLETIAFHGWVNFYSSIDKVWFQFKAKFTDGKLATIERISPREADEGIDRLQKKFIDIIRTAHC